MPVPWIYIIPPLYWLRKEKPKTIASIKTGRPTIDDLLKLTKK